ncbi:MAG: hypothetical protein IRY94_00935 [Rhodospirillaceae bacterium]|nr:hypothetical protein [Rhodospirillaceae bacterium]
MVFAITNAKEFREKVEEDLGELAKDIANSSRAMNATLSTYHLHEWLWSHVLKRKKPVTLGGSVISSKADFVSWLAHNCPHFTLLQQLANGSKHAYPVNGSKVAGFGQGPYGIGPYSAPYLLLIDLGAGVITNRYLVASTVICQAGDFMVSLAKSHGA